MKNRYAGIKPKLRLWPKGLLLCTVLLIFFAIVLPYAISRVVSPWRCLSFRSFDDLIENENQSHTPHLRVSSYNIAHGRGIAESNWGGGSLQQRLNRLDQIAALLNKIDADIIVLNEVDFESSWSHSMNQAKHLAMQAEYPYWLEQRNFDLRIFMWTWRFGNAVLSKHPIIDANVIEFPDFSIWETILAGKKRGITCDIDVNGQVVTIFAAHLSHRSELLRVESALMFSELTKDNMFPTIIAGDLNSTPTGFPNSLSDRNGDNAMDIITSFELFNRFPQNPPTGDDEFTFHSINPTSIIDWILIPRDWNFLSYVIYPSNLSDHRLVYADIVPNIN